MKRALSALFALGLTASALPASALPGFYAGKGSEKRIVRSTHIVVMNRGDASAITIMPDYEGPLTPFALVMAVPADVVTDRVKTLKREFMDRVENLTAPRFHEFWEMDPCEPGKPEQYWEQKFSASSDTDFLGGPKIGDPTKKVAKELFIQTDADFKEGEYGYSILDETQSQDVVGYLSSKGYTAPAGAAAALKPYLDKGMKILVAEVDSKRIELAGGDYAILSPIRYWSEKPVTTLPLKLGLLSGDGKQETFVYTFDPKSRYSVKNYENLFAPTNLTVDFVAKERMGELYTAMHDLSLAKNPKGVLVEYAWPSEGCGEPCQNERMLPHELMSLGGDVFEQFVPEEEREPEPPPLTEEEEKIHDAKKKELKGKEKKEYEKTFEEERKIVAKKKALIARNKYIVTRLHHRYDADNLPEDFVLAPAAAVEGGAGIPQGENHEISSEVKQAKENKLQVRYNFFHPWKGMMKCEKPVRHRWGKPPRTYRGLRKIWVAVDLARKNRKQIVPTKVVQTAVPSLGLEAAAVGAVDAGPADAGAGDGAEKKKSCGCRAVGAPVSSSDATFALGALALLVGRRRRRRER
ncbi:MAG: DUF2330 domain-containing protein [Polyangiaceae bacterium]